MQQNKNAGSVLMRANCENKNCRFNGSAMCKKSEIVLDQNGTCMDYQPIHLCGACRFRIGGRCEKMPWGAIPVGTDAPACYYFEEK